MTEDALKLTFWVKTKKCVPLTYSIKEKLHWDILVNTLYLSLLPSVAALSSRGNTVWVSAAIRSGGSPHEISSSNANTSNRLQPRLQRSADHSLPPSPICAKWSAIMA